MSHVIHETDAFSLDTNEEAMMTLERLMQLRHLLVDVMDKLCVIPPQLIIPMVDMTFFIFLQAIDRHCSGLMYEERAILLKLSNVQF